MTPSEALRLASESRSTQAAVQQLGISPKLLYRWQEAKLIAEVGSMEVESFWSRFKIELLDGDSVANLTEARLEISHYLAYYTNEWRHAVPSYYAPTTSKASFTPCPNSMWLS